MSRKRFLLGCVFILMMTTRISSAHEIGWPEAVSRLAGERYRAETCVRILKQRGAPEQVDGGSLVYARAKADNDAVIAGLLTSLALSQRPVSLPTLDAKLQSSTTVLTQFCEMVSTLVPPTPEGQKGVLDGILKAPIEAILKPLSEGVAAIWNRHNETDALVTGTIRTQLEAAKWPDFADVKPVQ